MIKKEIWIDEIHKYTRYGIRGQLLIEKKSKFQDIKILKTKGYGNALMLNNCWMTCDENEKYYHECLVHPALTSSNNISNILIIGGGDGGTARECLKYKEVQNIDLVEIDEEVLYLSKKYLTSIGEKVWSDKRLSINICDGFTWIKNIKTNYYDAVIIDCSDPSEFSNELFTLEFYRECKRVLKFDGMFATQSESPESFMPIHIEMCKSIKKIFMRSATMYGFVPFYPSGIWSWTFASSNENQFLKTHYKDVKSIEDSCEIWNLNYQEGSFKMLPNKLAKLI